MKKKGYTLIEVIISIALIGLIAATFLPMISFGVINTFSATEFTDVLYDYQEKIEKEIDIKRDENPDGITTFEIFGNDVTGHDIHINDDSSGEIFMFLPKRIADEPVPAIESPPVIDIRFKNSKINRTPQTIGLFEDNISLFVKEIDITSDTDEFYLMSVYRWYISSEMNSTETASDNPNQYFIVKEWNEAKKQLSYVESGNLKFIPNIKDFYNVMVLSDIEVNFGLTHEEFINSFGNRYIRYGVTPFSLRGKIGTEELSNAVYIEAPRIELLHAIYADSNKVVITFQEDISGVVDTSKIILNESMTEPTSVFRDESNHKQLILEFDSLDTSEVIAGNKLLKGAVQSDIYGRISIIHNNVFEGEFSIYDLLPTPVVGVTIDQGVSRSITIGTEDILTATVDPPEATYKDRIWTSSNSDIVSVSEDGEDRGVIAGVSVGEAVIRATSAVNPTAYDEITIKVLSEEEVELQEALDSVTLTVSDPTGENPYVNAPSYSNGIEYTFKVIDNPSRISLSNFDTRANVTRPGWSSNDETGIIRLTAEKDSYSAWVEYDVFIAKNRRYSWNTRGSVTITKR